jgi:glycosyltransferase involved in cell wall biosynthesis
MDLTVVVLTQNESSHLPDLFKSLVEGVSVLVVDSMSTDQTVDIARKNGAQVIETAQWPGFGPQRNLALQQVQTQWVLFLDADERIQPQGWQEIRSAIDAGASAVYSFPRLTNFAGSWIKHCGWHPDRVVRLFKVGEARYSDDLVHERVVPHAGVKGVALQTPLLHFSYPDPAHYWKKMQTYSMAWADQQWAAGVRTSLTRAILSSVVAFVRSYVFRLGFLDGASGLAVCVMQAQATYSKYFMLYWKQQAK